jgi:transposase
MHNETRSPDRIKCLFSDRGGFVLYYKRLARGHFRLPHVGHGADRIVLDATELAMLLGGYEVARSRRQIAWEPTPHRASTP